MTLGEVLAGLHGMAEIPGMPDLAEMPPDGFTFQIPPCQRPYRWKLSDIEHVLADVADMRSAESTTLWYFGPICFRRDKDVMQIYDGQQRLTSMLLVVSVLAERLQADGANLGLSEEQAERLRSAAEGAARFSYERPATVDAIMLMAERLRNRFGVNRTAEAAQFDVRDDAKRVVWMLDHVFFSATVLRSDIEAAQYFQGENNRGASMQLVDLVKSLNLRFVPEADLEKHAALWTNLAEQRTRGTFQGSDAVERVLLPSMLIVRGLWTFEAEANDADDYRHFISGRGDFARKRISDSRAGTQGEATFPTLSSMPRTGVPFFRTLVWSAVLLAAVRRTLDTEADDYQQYITGQELEPLLCNGLVYWADAFMTDADGSMPIKVENFSLTLADEARWTSTESSFVNHLTLENGVLDVSGEDNTLTVDNLKGTTGDVRLGARMVDGQAEANKLTVKKVEEGVKGLDVSFEGVTSDDVKTPEEVAKLMENSVTIAEGKKDDFKQTGTVDEGAINGAVSVETNGKGEIVSSSTEANTKLEDFKEVTSVSFVQWRNEVNHLTRRMGDLRSSESGVGAWARVHGGESKVKDSSVEFDTTSVQVGADARVSDWIVGSALSYNDSSIDLANGDGDGESWSLAVYASRFFDSGAFIDLTGRYGYLKNEFTSKDMGVKTDNHAFALSAEVGHRFEVAKNAYVEPQVELAYGFIKGDDVTASNGVRLEQDDAQTLTGRVGLRFGADCPNDRGTVYGLVSYNYEFLGDIESRASLGDKSARMERSLDGGWFSYGIGAQANISKTWSAYGELERTSGGDVENPWRWSVGVRHVF